MRKRLILISAVCALALAACGGDGGEGGNYADQLRGAAVPASAGLATPVPQPTTPPQPTPAPLPTAAPMPTSAPTLFQAVQDMPTAAPQTIYVTATPNPQEQTIINDLLTGGVEPCYMGADGRLYNADGTACAWRQP